METPLLCQTVPLPFDDSFSIFEAELWDPTTQTFTLLAAAQKPRNYHSVAVR